MSDGHSHSDRRPSPPIGEDKLRFGGHLPANTYEAVHRYFITLLAGLAIGWATQSYFPVGWALLYVLTNGIYQSMLHRHRGTLGTLPLGRRVFGFIISTLVYVSMIIFLWIQDDPILKFAGISGLIGLGLHSIARPQKVLWVMVIDSLVIVAIYVFMAGSFLMQESSLPTLALLVMCLFSVASYFVASQWRAYSRAQAIEAAELRLLRNREMEAMGRLTGGFAHDFNNILAAMRGNLDLYDEVSDPAEKRRIMKEAREATARAARLTQKLLSYSRKAVLRPTPIVTGAFVTEFVAMMGRNLPETILLKLEIADNPPPVFADAQTLEMVLANLVMNAADAIGEQIDESGEAMGGDIILSCRPIVMPAMSAAPAASEVTAGQYLRIALSDSGPGIPAELLPHICEPFYTTKPVGRGSGLGLPMAQGFAEQSGGALRVSSAPSGGALVELYLPLRGAR